MTEMKQLNEFFENKVEVPRIRVGEKKTIETLIKEEVTIDNKECSRLQGSIKAETPKAVLINLASGQELWVPKSKIHSEFKITENLKQSFIIDNWILEKNKITA